MTFRADTRRQPGPAAGTLVIERGMLEYAEGRAIRFGIPVIIQHPMLHRLAALFDQYY